MKYSSLIIILLLACCIPSVLHADEKWQRKPEAYWQAIAEAKGEEKIHLLNKLAIVFINTGLNRPDSALHYAKQSFQLAKKMGNAPMQARTAELCGNISLQLSQVDDGLTYYRLAARLAEELQNPDLLAASIRGIGHALWYSGKFSQAIDTIRKVMHYFKAKNLEREFADATMVISSIYSEMGNYEKAFEVAQESLKLSRASGDFSNIILSLAQLGYLYKNVGDYQTAMGYFQQAFAINPPTKAWCYRLLCNRVGDLYTDQKKFDSAFYFYSQSLNSHSESKTSLLRMADYWLATKQYQKAEALFGKVYEELRNSGEGNLLVFSLIGLGKTSIAKQDWQKAIDYGYKALAFAKQRDTRLTLRDAYQLLYQTYDPLNKPDSAYAYYKKFVIEKEAVVSDQFKGKIFAYKQESQIQLLASEKLMAEQELKSNQLLRNILLVGIFLLLLFGAFLFWNISLKRKNEKLKNNEVQTALKQRATEMEMQALRAQMNPHFIFNALSSVNRFILKNDAEKASDYLTRFSRLIRLVLVNSQRETISLENEIEMLRLYLQMEQLRFNHAFDFSIKVEDDIIPADVFLPPLLLQPFCENAIWHGLMHRSGGGMLEIVFRMRDEQLLCTIRDNGIGRKKAAELSSKSAEKIKSLGLRLTNDRLALFNNQQANETTYEIADIMNEEQTVCGTEVKLQIRHHSIVNHKNTAVVC